MKVATSVLTITENIKDVVERLNHTTTDFLHLDVMDGKFVENNTVEQMDTVLQYNKKPLDIHLMVEDVLPFVQKYQQYHPEYITFHVELDTDILSVIKVVKKNGIKVGLALNPDTDLSLLLPYLSELDLVLVMSVKAGYGGQVFDERTKERIETLLRLRDELGYHYQIEVDGGINSDTVAKVDQADIVVSGSYIMNGDYQDHIQKLKKV